ncbi:MAG: tandem-95 repeat protein [Gemmataceae bacterium]
MRLAGDDGWRGRRAAVRSPFARLGVEPLEARLAPANLTLTSLSLVDAAALPITAPVVGQQVYLRAEWSATGLTPGSTYLLRFKLDDTEIDSPPMAGLAGTFTDCRALTFATAGPHTALVKVDIAGQVAETDETDNLLALHFTPVSPVSLAEKFVFPLTGEPNRDFAVTNYVDVDPRLDLRADYRGGPFQLDGHDGIDVGPATWAAMDAGMAVVAAAGGTVIDTHDGDFDRRTGEETDEPGNFVVLDHGNGWTTTYLHLAAGSVTVNPGDRVERGTLLGLVGSSGLSTAPHLHWTVRYRGAVVETGYDLASYFETAPVYQGDAAPTVRGSGVTNEDCGADLGQPPSAVDLFPRSADWSVFYWYQLSNLRAGSTVQVRWYQPDHSLFAQFDATPGVQQPSSWYGTIGTGWKTAVGTWQVALVVDGQECDRRSFTVTDGAGSPELHVMVGAETLLDHRATPIDLGTVAAGQAGTAWTFTVVNHGAAALTLADLHLPDGVALVGSFPDSVAPGTGQPITLRLDGVTAGGKFGEVRFRTNDADEPTFAFPVSGRVTGATDPATPVLSWPGPAIAYGRSKAATAIAASASLAADPSTGFAGSVLRAIVVAGGSALDVLGVQPAGEPVVAAGEVRFAGVVVATMSGGSGSVPLTIRFNAAATVEAVQAVLHALTYANTDPAGDSRPRFLGLTFTDATGRTSDLVVKRVSSTRTPLNDAPILTPENALDLAPVHDTVPTDGTQVADFAGPALWDRDLAQSVGIALFETNSTVPGSWQYQRDGEAAWHDCGAVAEATARLLAPGDRVRFLPSALQSGTATIRYRGWDGTQGVAGGTFDLSHGGGGSSAFSAATTASVCAIHANNDPPSFVPGPDVTVDEDAGAVQVAWASAIWPGTFVVQTTDASLFAVPPAITSTGVLTFTPAANAHGSTTVTVRLRDSGGAESDPHTFTVTIRPVNDAPVLTGVEPVRLSLIDNGSLSPRGVFVGALLGSRWSDPDGAGTLRGLAVFAPAVAGIWQWSGDGVAWASLGEDGAHAILLRDTDQVRFLPSDHFTGTAALTARGWDQSSGSAGETVDLTLSGAVGGTSAFSAATLTATVAVGWSPLKVMEDTTQPAGCPVATLLADAFADADPRTAPGIAVVSATAADHGRWEYLLAGSRTWLPVGAAEATARLLRATDRVRFVPARDYSGVATIRYRGWDRSVGVPGGTIDLSAPAAIGGATAFSMTMRSFRAPVVAVGDRPVLTPGTLALTSILPGTIDPPGDPVAALLAGRAADADPGDVVGVAVIAMTGKGVWEYAASAGGPWRAFGTLAPGRTRLLAPTTCIRFRPEAGFRGVATLSYRAWDGTAGQAGAEVAVARVGSALSIQAATATVAVNVAPVLDDTTVGTLPAQVEDIPVRAGYPVAQLLGRTVAAGVAVTELTGTTNGRWEFSLDGGRTWRPFGNPLTSAARLLRATDRLRFLAGANFHGTVALTFHACDRSAGSAGGVADVSQMGGATPFSVTDATVALTITAVPDRPALDLTPTPFLTPLAPNAGRTAGDPVAHMIDAAFIDVDGTGGRGIALVGLTGQATGVWEVSTDGGSRWDAVPAVSATAPLLLRGDDRLRYVPSATFRGLASVRYRAWDPTSGTTGLATETATVAVNTAPTLDDVTDLTLPTIAEDAPSSPPLRVAVLLAGAVHDADPAAQTGIAVVGASGPDMGVWNYSIDGMHWRPLLAPSAAAAVLLRSTDSVRFVPRADFVGTATLQFRAWDRTAGVAGGTLDLTLPATTGAFAAFSAAVRTANLPVRAVNDRPVLHVTGTPTLTPLLPGSANLDGDSVAALLGTWLTDAEGSAGGVALVATGGPLGGVWKYSIDGGPWTLIEAVSPQRALLLKPTDRLLFVPVATFRGTATLVYRGWDRSAGTAGAYLDSTATAVASAFSRESAVAYLAVNTAPTLTP